MQLLQDILGHADVGPGMEDGLHDLGIASDLLLVACCEFLDLKIGQQLLDFAVGKIAALDAG
ncbi:MAG: hypothetical protein HQL44_16840 [Alphaproteobacteria bacterium]|nr:hypothetical protein [Alphaproteobacteria bacterium]